MHFSTAPKEGATLAILIRGEADNVFGVVDAGSSAVDVAGSVSRSCMPFPWSRGRRGMWCPRQGRKPRRLGPCCSDSRPMFPPAAPLCAVGRGQQGEVLLSGFLRALERRRLICPSSTGESRYAKLG